LEKAKSAALPLSVPPLQVAAIAAPVERYEQAVSSPSDTAYAEDLYLRNRVLLI